MSAARVVAVAPGSPAQRAGLEPGDEVLALNGHQPRDVLQWQVLADDADLEMEIRRSGIGLELKVTKVQGEPLGAEVHSAVFDRVRTCDNHCEFCFIYQLPPGLRPSLYVKDDDYRLSFLYGNFTTLTRFTELDLERVVTEGLGPLYVSVHATDPDVRARMLRNRRGATSLRWLRALLDHGVEVHGQVVVCPGVNDGPVLEDTLAGVLDSYPALATMCVVPLGLSRYSREEGLRIHTVGEAGAVLQTVEEWQQIFLSTLGRRLVFAADEYYLLAGRPFPPADSYEGFPQHENGVGMARTFELELMGERAMGTGVHAGFFAWVDGAPAEGYRAPRVQRPSRQQEAGDATDRARAPVAVLTGVYGAKVLAPLLRRLGRDDVRVVPVSNEFFGGNIGVAGLLVGQDVGRVLCAQPAGHRYLLPDVCL
ncbi:MAG: DUF512 domain-containing protein, partial [Acidimicrobiia bacterium]|nr:DUF512 domain-containing protein [Acidimicrobiia bacterium]